MPKTITLDMLYAMNACQKQVDLFAKTFGRSVDVTVELCEEHASRFDFRWAAQNFLSASLLAEYARQHARILAEYDRQHAPIWAEYAPIWAEYERQHAPIWAEYLRQRARIFATLFLAS